MLTALDFWHLVEHIIPVYVVVILAYALTKSNLIAPEHAPGISRWVSLLGVPSYVFHLLAFNDPYQMSLRLVAADVVSKALALICSCLWWKFSKSGSIEGVIGFFMLATLPNTVLVGDALLQPLYGDEIHTQVVTIIFMQSFLWYNICICFYEAREVLLQEKEAALLTNSNLKDGRVLEHIVQVHDSNALAKEAEADKVKTYAPGNLASFRSNDFEVGDLRKSSERFADALGAAALPRSAAILERTISAPAGFPFSRTRSSRSLSFKCTLKAKVCDFDFVQENVSDGFAIEQHSPRPGAAEKIIAASRDDMDAVAVAITSGDANNEVEKMGGKRNSTSSDGVLELVTIVQRESVEIRREEVKISRGFSRWGILGVKVIHRIRRVPLTYASLAGFIYSLIARKYNWDMPYPVRTSLELISQTAVGIAIFLMGLAWAKSGRLISCGWKVLVYGLIVRFIIGPILMIVSAKAVLMKGQAFQFAVVQAVISQGVISFVLAKEYGVDVPLFNTAVIFQLVIFIPIAICYYIILDAL
ncbi:hypothetical protein R1flu_010810 [Riccia fluitans]|uniref:Auxin efflux carrier component n=1 Tax=Riccia fluitans TaxID=41844 RepID=A0ABD1Z663_9MARC